MLKSRTTLYIIIVIITGFYFQTEIFPQSITFNHLTVEDGLSNNDVNTLIQDRTGFIWFGTDDGLNRYDGYNFKVFRNVPSDSTSLSDNSIWALMEDSRGAIWIGTKDGILNQFDPITEKFSRWVFKNKNGTTSSITALFEDDEKNIWIGTRTRGVIKLNPNTRKIETWNRDDKTPYGLSFQSIRSITQDNSGKIIIGTYYGLNKLDPKSSKKEIKKFYSTKNNPNTLSNSQIYNLTNSSLYPNVIWIGTPDGLTRYNTDADSFLRIKIPNPSNLQFGNGASTVIEDVYNEEEILWIDTYSGLVRLNLKTGEAHRFLNEKNNPHSLINNQINRIMMDKSGVIWIATENGISFYSSKSNKFNSYFNNTYQNLLQKINNKENLQAISQSIAGTIWLGFADGLVSVDNYKNKINLKTFPDLSKANIWSISSNDSQRIWIGTFGQGLKELNPKTGNIKEWLLYNDNLKVDVVLFVKSLLEDSKKNLWIGYWGSSLGTIQLSSGKSYVWYKEPGNEKSISHSDVWTIKEDRLGRIWLGTLGGGINLFNRIDSSFIHFKFNTLDESSLTSNNIYSICESKKGQLNSKSDTVLLWIGTSNGLNRVLVKYKNNNLYDLDIKVNSFTTEDGLGNNSVNSIVEDENGNLWLGTGSGITFFNIKNNKFSNFTESDGLNGVKMNYGSALQLEDGLMLFGSTKGLNIFDPNKIELSKFKPQVVFTDFQIFNQSIEVAKNSFLKESISSSKLINLPYDKNVFSFEFAALDYNSSKLIKYAYTMEGFDKNWIESGNRRLVTYTNLDPGKYTFKVKATNADGVWNDNYASIKIVISPPWWRTPWAYGLYIIFIGLGLLIIRRIELNRAKLRNELKIREFEANKKTELEKIKSRFFANLSHEFRTPLMLIKGPLEQIKNGNGNGNDKFSESINIIERNSDKLKELIDQLLELSQLENAAIPLKAKKENIFIILKGIVASFNSLAEQKNIKLNFTSNLDSAFIWIDRDKFEKVIINLLSNAFKFTPDGGIVQVTLNHSTINEKEFAEIIISDSGIGIAKQKLDKIFDRFYQVDDSTQRSYGGSGIGLALVKEFVQLHKWSISVESEEGNGAQFTLKIPMWDDYLNDDDKILSEVSSAKLDNENYLLKNNSEVNDLSEVTETKFSGTNKQSILIVDDSDDVRKYLSSLLKDNFDIFESKNGEEGIKSASEILPDLIISDVMMPSMDGFEFCEKIKSNWQTSDIPVILLTAKASFESKLEGLEIGADDYLTKPFDTRELFIRIKNLLEQRRRVREKYSGNLNLIPDAKQLNTSDNDFIKKAVDLINKNLDNVDFNTDKLAKELFMSRTQLHRKFLSITEQAPGEFIRTIKLNRAAKLLVEKNLSVAQIAFEVGFSSPAQFTRAFTKQFNCVPSEYSQAPKS